MSVLQDGQWHRERTIEEIRERRLQRIEKRLEVLEEAHLEPDRVQILVDYMDFRGLLEDHCFTFSDGLTIYATRIREGK